MNKTREKTLLVIFGMVVLYLFVKFALPSIGAKVLKRQQCLSLVKCMKFNPKE